MRGYFKEDKIQSGFTVVEIIVALFGFSLVMLTVGLIFVQIVNLQQRGFAAQKVQENSLYITELMAREIRVSSIIGQEAANCNRSTLQINHPVNGLVVYAFDGVNDRLTRRQGPVGSPVVNLNSNDVAIFNFRFCVYGSVAGQDDQPVRVGILMRVRPRSVRPQDVITFDIETMVTSRDTTVEY